jgi:hypothetical protein
VGLALIDENERFPTISYLSKHSLSLEVKTRFKELFKVQSKWKRDDFIPYSRCFLFIFLVQDIVESTKDLDALMLKYARSSKQAGLCYLSPRF